MTAAALESAIGHRFTRRDLLTQALTHRSFGTPHNERLEFLGDSLLNCCIAALLYRQFPALKEGELSRLRASLVNQEALSGLALQLGVGDLLRLGEGEVKSGGRRRPSTIADALEALFGAIFLDAGFERLTFVIEQLYQPLLARVDTLSPAKDPKTELQEWLQGKRLPLPHYELTATQGEAHAQQFAVVCRIADLDISSSGTGSSRRAAEQEAAQAALTQVKSR